MAKVKFVNGSESKLNTLPLENGQVIFAKNGTYINIYYDDVTSDNDAQVIRRGLITSSGGDVSISSDSQYVPLSTGSGE